MAHITEVKFFPLASSGKIKAKCSVTLDASIRLEGFRIVEGADGLFVGWPSEKGTGGTHYGTCIALSKEIKEGFDQVILDEYGKLSG